MEQIAPRRIWRTRRAVVATLALAVWVPGCVIATWWQVYVALSGNGLAWLYSVEWPFFGLFGIIFWWFRIHDDPEQVGTRRYRALRAAAEQSDLEPEPARQRIPEREDPELAAYNNYLALLAAQEQQRARRRR